MAESCILRFLDQSRYCHSLEDLTQLLQTTMQTIGFERWAYVTHTDGHKVDPVILHNYPKSWVDHYIDKKCHEIDPVVITGSRLTRPFQWSTLSDNSNLDNRLKTYTHEAADFGLVDGFAIPILRPKHRASLLSVSSDGKPEEITKRLEVFQDQLIALSFAYHGIATEFLNAEPKQESSLLSCREKEYLLSVMQGKTAKEIARLMNISPRTVVFHSNNIKSKLNVMNLQHAVVKAIMEGHICP